MSYQVGFACYATVVDAGGAACSNFSPVTTMVSDGSVVRTVSCSSADPNTGALNLRVVSSPVDGSPSTVTTVSQVISYPDCVYGDFVVAGEAIFAAILGAWALIYGANLVRNYLDWSRGES